MRKIYIDADDELTTKRLTKIIRYHTEHILPEMKFNRGYYDGTGQQITQRTIADNSKPNNKIVKNYCKTCVENFRGYITGIPITYAAMDADVDASTLLQCLTDNDVINSDSE